MTRIPFNKLKHGGCYKINSRNLTIGVYDEASKGYIGIREKFGDEYLFTEYDWEIGPPHGTATPLKLISIVPAEIPISEYVENNKSENKLLFKYIKDLEIDSPSVLLDELELWVESTWSLPFWHRWFNYKSALHCKQKLYEQCCKVSQYLEHGYDTSIKPEMKEELTMAENVLSTYFWK